MRTYTKESISRMRENIINCNKIRDPDTFSSGFF